MRVGVVSDTHLPWCHPLYLDFCLDTFAAWKVNKVHHIGDVCDHYALSRFSKDPAGPSAGHELDAVRACIAPWYKAFPKLTISTGNHDRRLVDRAAEAGIPRDYLKAFNELWGTPKWVWKEEPYEFDGVLYEHGFGSGATMTLRRATEYMQNLVCGHTHAHAGVSWLTNYSRRVFGLNVGAGVDCAALAFAYGKPFIKRPVLGVGIVIDGVQPYFVAMPCGVKEKYHRSRASKKK